MRLNARLVAIGVLACLSALPQLLGAQEPPPPPPPPPPAAPPPAAKPSSPEAPPLPPPVPPTTPTKPVAAPTTPPAAPPPPPAPRTATPAPTTDAATPATGDDNTATPAPATETGPTEIRVAPVGEGTPAPTPAAETTLAPEATDRGAAATTTMAKPESGEPEFIKGELIYVGTRRLLSRFDHVGIAAGPYILGNDLFLSVTPGMAYYGKTVSISLGAPLNLLAVEGGSFNFGGMRIRREDWNEVPDYPRVLRFFTIGRKEDNLYFTINSLRPATIGYGTLLNKYQGNIDVDRSMTGMIFDAYNKYGGFQFQANDITTVNRVIGGLVFAKPLSLFTDNILADSLSLGAEYVADFAAPRCVRTRTNKDNAAECVPGSGSRAGFDPYTGQNLDRTFARSNPDTGRFDVTKTKVHAAGASVEMKIYKDERNADIKLFGTWDKFLNPGGGSGASGGVLARLNLGTTYINAFRIQAELRSFEDGFLPSYFDSLYEIQKYSYALTDNPYQVTPTKYQAVFGDAENGFARRELGRRTGYNVEASWGVFKGSRRGKQLALGFGLSDSKGPDDTQFYAHLESPFLGFLQIFGTYMKLNEPSPKTLFKGNVLTAENAVVLTGARLEILPILFVNAHYSRSFRTVRSPGSEYHLGNDRIVDGQGRPSPYFPEARLFENVQTLFLEIELGWEFESSDDLTRREEDDK
ncbi:MAG: hypothetical protein HY903_03250 [Deltaproteobacteria bacterium]|nr:hypothetical protein [Deltaproteobacteria bacterium]